MIFQTGHGAQPHFRPKGAAHPTRPQTGGYVYLFPKPSGVPQSPSVRKALKTLAAQMAPPASDAASDVNWGALHSLGRFLGHDLSFAYTDNAAFDVDLSAPFDPLDRDLVTGALMNGHSGHLHLECLYGRSGPQAPFEARLQAALRDPDQPAKMRLTQTPSAGAPSAFDVLRLGGLIGRDISTYDVMTLTNPELRQFFFRRDPLGGETLNLHRAILGDGRNGDIPALTRVHLAWLRLHNAIVDTAPDVLRTGPVEDLFDWARDQTRAVYQWVMVFDGLAQTCDHAALGHVLAHRAPLYSDMMTRVRPALGHLPIPLEFCYGVIRCLDGFAGGPAPDTNAAPARIGTQLSGTPAEEIEAHLRVSHLLNLPTAQGCIAEIEAKSGFVISPLAEADLLSGPTGAAIADTDLVSNTPLWFYILKEAEVLAHGAHLGPLGSMVLADTVVGLLVHDPSSVLNRVTEQGTGWTPEDGPIPAGRPIKTFRDVLITERMA
ncbi:hypothetical protein [Pseudooctadecabacter sp.]|uniref:hypothetical protein n=1 Tax=Pseudooctadecabacter sp. TaxID=1966338 RepID=UPI0035C7C8DA